MTKEPKKMTTTKTTTKETTSIRIGDLVVDYSIVTTDNKCQPPSLSLWRDLHFIMGSSITLNSKEVTALRDFLNNL
jgi:hypothetical protein